MDKLKAFYKAYKVIIKFILKCAFILLVSWSLLTYVIGVASIRTNSMFPMIKDGDFVISYKLDKLILGDPVLYSLPDGTITCGRIIGLPGDEVSISDGLLLVNGQAPADTGFYPVIEGDINLIVPENSVFVLNDYRLDIGDSRVLGPVSENNLKGKVVFLFRWRGL